MFGASKGRWRRSGSVRSRAGFRGGVWVGLRRERKRIRKRRCGAGVDARRKGWTSGLCWS
jgi:hypothetical protein